MTIKLSPFNQVPKKLFSSNKKTINLNFILISLLVLGILFRFINIDNKSYWDDEAFTSLRVAGYTEYEVVQKVSSVDNISAKELQNYQTLSSSKSLFDTIQSLALEDPQHPPAYYVINWLWVRLFGSSIVAFRTVAALASLLALPSMYWLCQELFASSLPSRIAVTFIAISPFHILYAQEARQYSLWTAMILFSSASLLYASRKMRIFDWVIYAASLALNFYTFPFSVLVALAHGSYVIALDKFRFTKRIIAYLLASFVAVIAFIPWLLVIINNLKHINNIVGGKGGMPTLSLVKTWAFNLSRIFVDTNHERAVINFGFENIFTYLLQITLVFLLVMLSGYSIYFVCRRTHAKTWIFLLTLILLTSVPIMGKDLLSGDNRSIILRYLTPAYLGIHISVSYLLAAGITTRKAQNKFWYFTICLLFSGALFSSVLTSQATSWWTKSHSDITYKAAKIINQSQQPLIVSDGSMGTNLALSHQLNPQVQLRLKPYCHTCRSLPPELITKNLLPIPNNFDVFLFVPSPELMNQLSQDSQYKIEFLSPQLWRLTHNTQ
ncbi:glycosyltransferase family 39 protein [Anabaena sphaerica FACHB-251]|uniref:Glycosyltransferase family 39 protein n=1 Tax=Anabaena sphaerica FACHB-251 TaxID=2692883 RepID=A0A926WKE7_9NOST|nr:glycosyltransferase family 39 protein [Anabaena sphaerica]MBD2296190.1 glycosyltransferase family 39 protein [Anabaena sphaerica FACHB-251]